MDFVNTMAWILAIGFSLYLMIAAVALLWPRRRSARDLIHRPVRTHWGRILWPGLVALVCWVWIITMA